jgi:invasion protein IalB
VTTAGPGPRATEPAAASTPLRIVLRGGGRLAARLTARVAAVTGGITVTSAAVRARVAHGRWRLKLCAAAAGRPRRCALGPRAVAAHGSVRLAAVRVLLPTRSRRITVTAALVGSSARPAARGTASTA